MLEISEELVDDLLAVAAKHGINLLVPTEDHADDDITKISFEYSEEAEGVALIFN